MAIIACDLAEVLGSAIALKLLFGIPIVWGCVITVADVLLILLLQNKGFRYIEAVVITLVMTIGACFAFLIAKAGPDFGAVMAGFVPRFEALLATSRGEGRAGVIIWKAWSRRNGGRPSIRW